LQENETVSSIPSLYGEGGKRMATEQAITASATPVYKVPPLIIHLENS
jgi:hypothetical protein